VSWYGCFIIFIGGETVHYECPLQSREEVEVAGCQVGTVGGMVQVLETEGGNMVAAAVWSLASSSTLIGLSWNCWHHRRTTCVDMMWGPYSPLDDYGCLPGTHYFVALSLTQHCASTACMMVVRPTTNEEGCLWTQNTVTPHQFYADPGNKMGKLIIWLSYVFWRCVVKFSAGTPAMLTGFSWLSSIPPGKYANIMVVLWLGFDHFLRNPFQFISHLPSYHSTLYNVPNDSILN
jgi:hypothetical protein